MAAAAAAPAAISAAAADACLLLQLPPHLRLQNQFDPPTLVPVFAGGACATPSTTPDFTETVVVVLVVERAAAGVTPATSAATPAARGARGGDVRGERPGRGEPRGECPGKGEPLGDAPGSGLRRPPAYVQMQKEHHEGKKNMREACSQLTVSVTDGCM